MIRFTTLIRMFESFLLYRLRCPVLFSVINHDFFHICFCYLFFFLIFRLSILMNTVFEFHILAKNKIAIITKGSFFIINPVLFWYLTKIDQFRFLFFYKIVLTIFIWKKKKGLVSKMVQIQKFFCFNLFSAGLIIGWLGLAGSITSLVSSIISLSNVDSIVTSKDKETAALVRSCKSP